MATEIVITLDEYQTQEFEKVFALFQVQGTIIGQQVELITPEVIARLALLLLISNIKARQQI